MCVFLVKFPTHLKVLSDFSEDGSITVK